MKATLTVDVVDVDNPFTNQRGRRPAALLIAFIAILRMVFGGGVPKRRTDRPSVVVGKVLATGTVAPAAVVAADTFSVNGTAMTATECRANCTVTVGTSVDEGDTVTVNGLALTATATPTLLTDFLITGVAATDAAALVACINAQTSALVAGIIEAVRPAATGVVNIYAIEPGTAGNSYTIATSDAVDLAITNDNAGEFAGGAALSNNQFDPMGNDLRTAQSLADAINDSTTSLVKDFAKASVRNIVVTCASVAAGDYVELDNIRLKAVVRATDSAGARLQGPDDEWSQAGDNTADAVSLVLCINNHPKLGQKYLATSSSGAVTIRELPPEATTAPKLTSNNGTRLAVSAYASGGSTTSGTFTNNGTVLLAACERGLGGNAVTTASSNGTRLPIGGAAARLLGGTGETFTF